MTVSLGEKHVSILHHRDHGAGNIVALNLRRYQTIEKGLHVRLRHGMGGDSRRLRLLLNRRPGRQWIPFRFLRPSKRKREQHHYDPAAAKRAPDYHWRAPLPRRSRNST